MKNRPTFHSLALAAALALPCAPSSLHAAKDSTALEFARQLNQAFIEVADQVSPSVVVVRVAQKQRDLRTLDRENPFFEFLPKRFREELEERLERHPKAQEPAEEDADPRFNGQGSGVIIRKDGYILTNRHVVENAAKLRIRLRDGREFDGTIRGLDPQSDLAVIKIEADNLPAIKFADSNKVRVGEFAIAIGAPFDLDYSVTYGHVSAKGRSQLIRDPSMDQDFIQTDANINPGNSGGPLVNLNGEIIGINTLIRGLGTGLGFAIPANLAREVSDLLISEGKMTRAWLGVQIQSLRESPELRATFKDVKDGVVVRQIVPDGPAAKSKLEPADVILEVDGRSVVTVQQLKGEIRLKPIGKPVSLTVNRNGKSLKLTINPEAWPDMEAQPVVSRRQSPGKNEQLGLTVEPVTSRLAREFGIKQTTGLIITAIEEEGPAARLGLKLGDVITEVNKEPVKTVAEFNQAVKDGNLKEGLLLNLVSEGVRKFEILKGK